jgi:quinol monooxygenase YgiN
MLIVAGHIVVAAADIETFAADMRTLVGLAGEADGNLFFACAVEDRETGCVLVLEQWRDEHALDAHLAHPTVTTFFAQWGPKMRNELRKFYAGDGRAARD